MLSRRRSLRAQTDIPVDLVADGITFSCRTLDISPYGALIERVTGLDGHDARPFFWLRFKVRGERVLALARPTWRDGLKQAFRFIEISDASRLTLAEHMDDMRRTGMSVQ
ncbi:MAG: PilZ domain-containing protein [Polyangiaceae bacterium]